jgi:N-acetylglutamate synthase-like GNAT family acetyltransferase
VSASATLAYRSVLPAAEEARRTDDVFRLRSGLASDAGGIHALIAANQEQGRLLPRALGELRFRASHFAVVTCGSRIAGCAELAPLGGGVAEIRSLVVDAKYRGRGIAGRLVRALRRRAIRAGYTRLCAFAHDERPFLKWGFSIVPHGQVPEKIATDCRGCRHFGTCTQHGLVLTLPSRSASPAGRSR